MLSVLRFEDDQTLSTKEFIFFLENIIGKRSDFVFFVHASWCGACQSMLPHVEEAIAALSKSKKGKGKGKGKYFVSVSDTVYSHMTRVHPEHTFARLLSTTVVGFPTLVCVTNETKKNVMKVNVYNGDRSTPSIQKFIGR